MEDVVSAMQAQHAELASIIDPCTDDEWQRPTRCEGWDVASVLLHLAQTDEMAVASARGQLDRLEHGLLGDWERQRVSVDDAAAAQVAVERAAGGETIRRRWHEGSQQLLEVLAAGDPHRRVTWVAGRLSLHTLAATRLSECWIHTGDIASALDVKIPPTDRLRHIARLAWRTLPYAFDRADAELHGPVALELIGPEGDEWRFDPDLPALTTIRGSAADFCEVASRRVHPSATDLTTEGPDGAAVLGVVRTYAQ